MVNYVLTITSLFLILAPTPSLQSTSCSHSITITGGNPCATINQNDSRANESVQWRCPDFQSALVAAVSLSSSLVVNTLDQQNCVSIEVPPGDHLITAPVHFGAANVSIFGTGKQPDNATIFCNYTVDVDETRIFDPGYSYTDYTFYFNRSEVVSFEGVQFVGCPYPLRLDTVANVQVCNSIFR